MSKGVESLVHVHVAVLFVGLVVPFTVGVLMIWVLCSPGVSDAVTVELDCAVSDAADPFVLLLDPADDTVGEVELREVTDSDGVIPELNPDTLLSVVCELAGVLAGVVPFACATLDIPDGLWLASGVVMSTVLPPS